MAQVKLIYDEEELKWFFNNVYPELNSNEVIFCSLSGRNKYLTEEERKTLEFSRTEMFAKTIVREKNWNKFVRTIRKLECDERGYTTKNNSPIPSKAIVCYININPSSTIKALNEFNKVVNEYMFELANVGFKKLDNENIMHRLNRINNNLLVAYQQSTGTKHWVDFDLDVDKLWRVHEDVELKNWFENKKIKTYFWIDTKSGYHLLVKKDELKFNPSELVSEIEKNYLKFLFDEAYGYDTAQEIYNKREIIQNKNSMIPLPGCLQGGYKVKVLNKEKATHLFLDPIKLYETCVCSECGKQYDSFFNKDKTICICLDCFNDSSNVYR